MLQEAKETFQAYKDNYVEQTDKVTAMADIAVSMLMFFKKVGIIQLMLVAFFFFLFASFFSTLLILRQTIIMVVLKKK